MDMFDLAALYIILDTERTWDYRIPCKKGVLGECKEMWGGGETEQKENYFMWETPKVQYNTKTF
jgi:hypothetical protein